MPLPGGPAAKFGILYEGRWTVHCMVQVMDEKADSIRLEPPGSDGHGIEFWLSIHGGREYHQAKRQNTAGHWTLSALDNKSVLTDFAAKLNNPEVTCVFVSSNSASQLKELCDRARSSASWSEYDKEFLTADDVRKHFNDLCVRLPNIQRTTIYEYLKRIRTETISDRLLFDMLEMHISTLVEDEPTNVIDVLAEMALERTHHELTAIDIWNHLEDRGFRRRQWDKDPHILKRLYEANERYLSVLRSQALANCMFQRDEAQIIFDILNRPLGQLSVLVTGDAGIGKSTVLLQVIERLQGEGTPILSLRVDRLVHTQLPDEVGEQIGLPGSPAKVIAAVAKGRKCVLVIDQLDALSIASGRNHQLFDCIHEIVLQAQAQSNVHILLACRRFDLDNDDRLRRLTELGKSTKTVHVDRLTHDVVRSAVSAIGMNSKLISSKQLDLLSVPLHLKLLSELEVNHTSAPNFQTTQDLYSHFWNHKQRTIREQVGRPIRWIHVIDALCDYMHNNQTLNAPDAIVEDWLSDTDAMISANVLVVDNNRYSFFHESFFDYAAARRFAAHRQSLVAYLLESNQALFHRTQVRQILHHLRDEEFDRYLNDVLDLLTNSTIRFHIKHLVLALLASLDAPREEEFDILTQFIGGELH